MTHAQKPDFVFRRNGRVHLNRRGRKFSRLPAAEMCASAVVMLDTPCSELVWRVLATHSIRKFLESTSSNPEPWVRIWRIHPCRLAERYKGFGRICCIYCEHRKAVMMKSVCPSETLVPNVIICTTLLLGRVQFSEVTDVRTSNLRGTNTHNNLLAVFFFAGVCRNWKELNICLLEPLLYSYFKHSSQSHRWFCQRKLH